MFQFDAIFAGLRQRGIITLSFIPAARFLPDQNPAPIVKSKDLVWSFGFLVNGLAK